MKIENLHPLIQRLIIGSISIAFVCTVIYFSFTPLVTLIFMASALSIIGLAVKEYYQIVRKKGLRPSAKAGVLLTIFYLIAVFFSTASFNNDLLPLIGVASSLIVLFFIHFASGEEPLINISATLLGIAYLAIPLGCLIQINYFFPPGYLQDGRWWLYYLLAVVYITDSGALFFGKTFGRTKLAPYISPNKTWEGAFGGSLLAIGASLLFAFLAHQHLIGIKLGFAASIVLGGCLSFLSHAGDLAESLLKRDAGVKDSSNIPGLGGMLDVLDSLVFTAPFLYIFLRFQNA